MTHRKPPARRHLLASSAVLGAALVSGYLACANATEPDPLGHRAGATRSARPSFGPSAFPSDVAGAPSASSRPRTAAHPSSEPSRKPPSRAATAEQSCDEVAPASSIWRTPADQLPRHARSDTYVQAIGAAKPLHPDFGSGPIDGKPFGIPVTTLDSPAPESEVTFDYADESDPAGYRIPSDARIENGPQGDGDRHVVVLDRHRCRSYELYDATPEAGHSWHAGSGAVFDLRSNALRPEGWTSADAAGLPILPGLVRYDEVAAGEIDHALRITVPRSDTSHLWPARHDAGSATDDSLPPMGLRLRLKSSVHTAALPPQARVIAKALQLYGAFVADNGSSWFVSGDEDKRWDNDQLNALKQLRGDAFEAVDEAALKVDDSSGAAR
ncbi:hypothetical protein [Streptomyces sp. NPDC048650]|uniref:hypothetical protein n=1 Tax=Streptomyces sp. NPDC048650 TaxID=3365583 RepID=UPI00371B9ABE